MTRVIWQYWETRGHKPAFVDGLHALARRNSGVEVVQVCPATLPDYLPYVPPELHSIEELAHKADMIRALLLREHGGMWLDSDAIVLKDLRWLFDLLEDHDFVGFNDTGRPARHDPGVRINCMLSRAGGAVVTEWVRRQHAKFPCARYAWTELGTDLMGPLCEEYADVVKLLRFHLICPVRWDEVGKFTSVLADARGIVNESYVVMLSNKSLEERSPRLRHLTVEELSQGDWLIADVLRRAADPSYVPSRVLTRGLRQLRRKLCGSDSAR